MVNEVFLEWTDFRMCNPHFNIWRMICPLVILTRLTSEWWGLQHLSSICDVFATKLSCGPWEWAMVASLLNLLISRPSSPTVNVMAADSRSIRTTNAIYRARHPAEICVVNTHIWCHRHLPAIIGKCKGRSLEWLYQYASSWSSQVHALTVSCFSVSGEIPADFMRGTT